MEITPIDISSRLDEEHRRVFDALPKTPRDWSDIPALRKRTAAARPTKPKPAASVAITERWVPGPANSPDLKLRIYRPNDLPQPAAALYWIHGGGTVLGDATMNDCYCANIADQLAILVTSIEYRRAPEHPFPTPLEDCYAGFKWLATGGRDLGVDPDRIAVGGISAGGLLSAALALLARDRAEFRPCFQLLDAPMLDDRADTPSSYMVTDPRTWDRKSNLQGWNAYLQGNAGGEDVSPYAAPARAVALAGLPPAYINVGDLDGLLDEDVAYAGGLAHAGVPVELHVYPGAYHGSAISVSGTKLSQRWIADELAALARALKS